MEYMLIQVPHSTFRNNTAASAECYPEYGMRTGGLRELADSA
jgi:hypothetical protein